MDKPKVFIDGREGTTGLQLWERLSRRTDLELLRIGEARRKDPAERKKYLNAADLVFLCLPDAAAWEAVGLIENGHTRIIDASTAHRTASGWVYGFPELYKDPERIIGQARRVANPGCHATGFLASAAPLSALHILLRDCPLTCFSLTGYSGGGRKMIAQYEAPDKPAELFSPRLYGTGLRHKHLTEMQKVAGLEQPPVFCPVVDDYYKGMATPSNSTTAICGASPPPGRSATSWRPTTPASPWSRCAGAGMPPPSPPTLWRAPTGWSWWCAATRSRPSSPPSSITWAKAPLARRCRT